MEHSQKEASLAASIANAPRDNQELKLGTLLVGDGIISPAQVTTILSRADKERVPFGQAAVNSGLVTEKELKRVISLQFQHKQADPVSSKLSRELVTAFRHDHGQANEIRNLRSRLMLQWLQTAPANNRTLAIVSPENGDGRSFIAANLAVAFAQSGHHTLLIDADMRKPRQHKLFGLANRSGLSSVLSGRKKGSVVYRPQELPGLSVLTAGGIPPNPAELLVPGNLQKLFAKCAHKYDVVVVDTPAAANSADAGIVASQANGYILLGQTGSTEFDSVKQLTQNLSDMGANLLGSIMTGK